MILRASNLLDRTTPLNVLHDFGIESSLLCQTHLRSIRSMRLPLGRVDRGSLFHHAVNLLQRQTLGLVDKEVRIDEAERAERTPDEEDLGPKISLVSSDHVRRDDGDNLTSCINIRYGMCGKTQHLRSSTTS
jgi:hypothetical protein